MIEIPCTIRCDGCKETTPAIAEAQYVGIGADFNSDRVRAFVVTDNVLPAGWRVVCDELRCPRCNGIK